MQNPGPHKNLLDDGGLGGVSGPDDGLVAFPADAAADPGAALLAASGGGGANGGNTVDTTTSLPAEPASPTAFTIAVRWDSSVASAPSGFTSDVLAAVEYLETQFVDPITITLNVGYNEIAGNSLGSGDLGESLTNFTSVGYSSLVAAVAADATTATDSSVVASLPATSPSAGATYWVSTAQSKALGLTPTNTTVDGSVGFGLSSLFTYGDTATSGTVAAGTYDFFATAVHEITETMGRELLTGGVIGGVSNSDTLLDLLHYAAPGVRDFSASSGYFSPNGGTSDLGAFNTAPSGDAGDWDSSVADDPFDAFASSGVLEPVSSNDLAEIDAIGWNSAAGTTRSASTPTGVSVTAATSSLAGAQGKNGLSGRSVLASFAQTGGAVTDTYGYTLGGPGAGAFVLTSSGNVAKLAVANAAAAGASNGKLYALTVTAKDTTSGNAAPAAAVNVVVGGSSADTITLASMPGIVSSAPTFIYGLGGGDTIKGTGMTGELFFDGGAGTDTMTGGSGANVYEYGAAGDSTVSAMDIITNFNVAVDLIDLTGIGTKLNYAGALAGTATSLAAGSIGFQTSGANTFVYVNTGTATEKLTSTNMKIELQGAIALGSGNFAHL